MRVHLHALSTGTNFKLTLADHSDRAYTGPNPARGMVMCPRFPGMHYLEALKWADPSSKES